MKKNKQPPAYYICATVDMFNIQVMLLVGDFDECCKLIEENRSPDYKGPKISDGLRIAKDETDKDCKTRNGYKAFTTHVGPGIIIYAPKPITLATLVHEISHAVDYIFHITGADDEELRAYLCGYLFTELAAKDENIIAPLSGNPAGKTNKEQTMKKQTKKTAPKSAAMKPCASCKAKGKCKK